MVHTIELGVGSEAALDFWAQRLDARGVSTTRADGSLRFADHDGLALELVVATDGNPPLRAVHPEVPADHAILGVEGARAFSGQGRDSDRELLTQTLGFSELEPGSYRLDGETRHFHWAYDEPSEDAVPGAGTVHHIAWHSADADHTRWQERGREAGMRVTPVIDRDYFHAIYFRQAQGILFELATTSPGFAVDEDADRLGEELRLPKQHEHLRAQLERTLTPLVNPRAAARLEA
jgi:glyoxalase family protein